MIPATAIIFVTLTLTGLNIHCTLMVRLVVSNCSITLKQMILMVILPCLPYCKSDIQLGPSVELGMSSTSKCLHNNKADSLRRACFEFK